MEYGRVDMTNPLTAERARNRMKKGDSLILTEEGMRKFPGEPTGTLMGTPRDPQYLTVRRDGQKSLSRFHASFWRKLRKSDRERLLKIARKNAAW